MHSEGREIIKNIHPESDVIEFYSNQAGFTPLIKSDLKNNTFYFFDVDFLIGDVSNMISIIDLVVIFIGF